MAQDDGGTHGTGSTWQLLLKLLAPGGAAGEDVAVGRIAEAMWELGLLPAQKERIERSIVAALREAVPRDEQDGDNTSVSIRVWTSGLATVQGGSSPEAGRAGVQPGRGAGFFLLERQEEAAQATEAGSQCVLELYLYQEAAGAR